MIKEEMFLRFDKIPTATAQTKRIAVVRGRVMTYKTDKVKEAEADFHRLFTERRIHPTIEAPIKLTIRWLFPTETKKRWNLFKVSRPDLDNMSKIIMDAMVKTGYFKDDSYVARLVLEKRWTAPGTSGIYICYEEIVE